MARKEVEIKSTISGTFIVERKETFRIEKEDIDDIMCSALEGGITYWCDRADVVEEDYHGEYAHEQISRNGSLRLHDREDDEYYTLTLEKFIHGIKLALEDGYGEDWVSEYEDRINPGQIDAIAADVIVQFALFGEVVYE